MRGVYIGIAAAVVVALVIIVCGCAVWRRRRRRRALKGERQRACTGHAKHPRELVTMIHRDGDTVVVKTTSAPHRIRDSVYADASTYCDPSGFEGVVRGDPTRATLVSVPPSPLYSTAACGGGHSTRTSVVDDTTAAAKALAAEDDYVVFTGVGEPVEPFDTHKPRLIARRVASNSAIVPPRLKLRQHTPRRMSTSSADSSESIYEEYDHLQRPPVPPSPRTASPAAEPGSDRAVDSATPPPPLPLNRGPRDAQILLNETAGLAHSATSAARRDRARVNRLPALIMSLSEDDIGALPSPEMFSPSRIPGRVSHGGASPTTPRTPARLTAV
jgi:hypothetical protein